MTPGQVAFDTANAVREHIIEWTGLTDSAKDNWETIARAAIEFHAMKSLYKKPDKTNGEKIFDRHTSFCALRYGGYRAEWNALDCGSREMWENIATWCIENLK